MNLMEQNKLDIQTILGNTNEFALELTFTAPNGTILDTVGQFFDRTAMFDSEGNAISSRHIIIHVSEQPFTDADYPMRRTDGIVTFKDHKVTAKYADGRTINCRVTDTQPDNSINLITLQLEKYE